MFPVSTNRHPLAVKLVAVLVLCAFFSISWHVFAAHHTDHVYLAEQCLLCTWMQTAVWLAVSVSCCKTLCSIQRAVFPSYLTVPIPSFRRLSGRSPPRR